MILIFLPVVSATQVFYVQLEVHKNETAEIKNIQVIDGEEQDYYGTEGPYNFYAANRNGEVLWSQERKMNWVILTNPPTPTDTLLVSLRIPYNKSASVIGVEKKGDTVIEENITERLCGYDNACSSYCSGKGVDPDCTCGDGVCQSHENAEICFEDCGEADVDDGFDGSGSSGTGANVSSPEGSDGSSGRGLLVKLIYVLIVVLVLVLLFIFWKSDF